MLSNLLILTDENLLMNLTDESLYYKYNNQQLQITSMETNLNKILALSSVVP